MIGRICLSLVTLCLIIFSAHSQREVIVEPTEVGILNNTINGDTLVGGTRVDPNTTYILRRGGVYKITGEIRNPGFPLRIIAESGSGSMPIIMPTPASGGDSQRPFTIQGDFEIDGIYVTAYNDLGGFADRIMRVNIADLTVNVRNCWFDGAGQSVLRFDTDRGSAVIENCVISHIGNAFNPNNGRIVDFRQNGDSLIFRNNTVYNITSRIMRSSEGFTTRYVDISQNTFMNSGQVIADLGEAVETVFTNNLFINAGFTGSARGGALVAYDSLSDVRREALAAEGIEQTISVYNNWFYTQPNVLEVYADSIQIRDDFFDSDMFAFMKGPDGQPIDTVQLFQEFTFEGPVSFVASPRISSAVVQGMIFDQLFAENIDNGSSPNWDFTESPFFQLINNRLLPDWGFPYDFAYSPFEVAATSASDGGQLGDRNWVLRVFEIVLESQLEVAERTRLFYPNPVENSIGFFGNEKYDRLILHTLSGRHVNTYDISKLNSLNLSALHSGKYAATFVNNKGEYQNRILIKR